MTSLDIVEQNIEVCGGAPRILGTRIPIWALEQARRLGASDSDIVNAFPTLRGTDLSQVWAYVQDHLSEIELQIQENEEA